MSSIRTDFRRLFKDTTITPISSAESTEHEPVDLVSTSEICLCGGAYVRIDSQLVCPKCGKIPNFEAPGVDTIEDSGSIVRCKGGKGKLIMTIPYNKEGQIMSIIKRKFEAANFRLSETIIRDIAVHVIETRRERSNRGYELDKHITGSADVVCNHRNHLGIRESVLSGVLLNSGGTSPGRNKVLRAEFVNEAQSGQVHSRPINQSEATKQTVFNALGKEGIAVRYHRYIYKLVILDRFLNKNIDACLNTKIAGSIRFYYRHIEGKNNIVINGLVAPETDIKYYNLLRIYWSSVEGLATRAKLKLINP